MGGSTSQGEVNSDGREHPSSCIHSYQRRSNASHSVQRRYIAADDELAARSPIASLPSEEQLPIQARGQLVAMTGDEINDAPALARADVRIAIGAGTDVAVETAGIVLIESDPLDVVDAVELASATYRKMVQNLFWATGYNAVAIPLAAGVLAGVGVILSPAVGAVLMSASTVIMAVNARLLRMPVRAAA